MKGPKICLSLSRGGDEERTVYQCYYQLHRICYHLNLLIYFISLIIFIIHIYQLHRMMFAQKKRLLIFAQTAIMHHGQKYLPINIGQTQDVASTSSAEKFNACSWCTYLSPNEPIGYLNPDICRDHPAPSHVPAHLTSWLSTWLRALLVWLL